MNGRLWSVAEKLALLGAVLWIADAVFQPYKPKQVSTPSQPLQIIWTNPVL